ncbi:molybdate ABC transporter substrate-binding protein [Thalassotalea ganghwensis]
MRKLFASLILLVTFFVSHSVNSQSLTIAVASNFYASAIELARAFEQQHDIKIQVATGASGALYAQIIKGAPFDLFLSADKKRPELLYQQDLAYQNQRYTLGILGLWMPKQQLSFNGEQLEKYQGKLAIANPKLAPYGVAAEQVLKKLNLDVLFQSKIIIGNNVNQAFHYVDSGNLDAGFVPLSLLKRAQQRSPQANNRKYHHFWLVPTDFYQPIEQHAVILKRTKQQQWAKKFLEYIRSDSVQQKLQEQGYQHIELAFE